MTPLIDSLYSTFKTVNAAGEVVDIHSGISRAEGNLLHRLISEDASIKRTLEVGCAYGMSSLHICEALRGREGAHHTIVDAFQKTDWQGIGLLHLEKAGINFYEWLEERSEYALPRLAQNSPASYDLIFIDGMHTFDHTLIDAFYSLRLLRIGGILIVDDCDFDAIDRVIGYLKNYPSLKEHASLPPAPVDTMRGKVRVALGRFTPRSSMIALKKIAVDERPWNWYAPF